MDLYDDPNEDGRYIYDCDDATVYPICIDTDCTGYDDALEASCNDSESCLAALTPCRTDIVDQCMSCGVELDNVGFLWRGSEWLNNLTNVVDQRTEDEYVIKDNSLVTSIHPDERRYLFTFADADNDMLVDTNEQIPFTCAGCTSDGATVASLSDNTGLFPYLTLYPTIDGNGDATAPWSFNSQLQAIMDEQFTDGETTFTTYLRHQAKRLVNFTRGEEQDVDGSGNEDLLVITSSVNDDYTIPAFRKRTVDSYEWRLGDPVYSTPTMVAGPAEAYNLLYRDRTYGAFAAKYQFRRGVVYMGTNDGIFHAFNAGFFRESYTEETTVGPDTIYTTTRNKFWRNCGLNVSGELECNDNTDYISLGAELWGYIPKNLLPHLYWLTEPDYDSTHVYYNDLKPRVFDAKIFEEEAACSLDINNPGCIHPGGWGTVLVGGMRLGGGEIRVDMNKLDSTTVDTYDVSTDRTMSSAYFILDITNPEEPPDVLAEITFPGLNFTTCYPTAIPVRDKDNDTGVNDDYNKWFLTFGNGPDDLESANSSTTGKVYVVYLNDLGKSSATRQLTVLSDTSPTPSLVQYDPTNASQPAYAQELEANTFVSDPIAVDYDLDFRADAVYFGTVTGDLTDTTGKLRRIVIEDDFDATNWDTNSVLLDLTDVIDTNDDATADAGQPITAAPSVAFDSIGNRWIFVGTGRYFVEDDETHLAQQSYYGIKEPRDSVSGNFNWATVDRDDLLDVTNIWVDTDSNVFDETGSVISTDLDTFDELLGEAGDHDGWFMDFLDSGERNIGQAALLGEVLSFTTYVPPDLVTNPCNIDGIGYLYALYYTTGTSFNTHILPPLSPTDPIQKKITIGPGLSISPNLHVGRDDGSKAILQTSTGQIEILQQTTPGATKSGKESWFERR